MHIVYLDGDGVWVGVGTERELWSPRDGEGLRELGEGRGWGAVLGRTGGSGVGGPMVRGSGSRPTQSDLGAPRSHQSVGGSARMIFAAISTGVRLQNFHNSFAERE